MRKKRYEYMHVILRNMLLGDIDIVRLTILTNQSSFNLRNNGSMCRFELFRNLYNTVLNVAYHVARCSVVLHTASLPRYWREGKGFSPIRREGR